MFHRTRNRERAGTGWLVPPLAILRLVAAVGVASRAPSPPRRGPRCARPPRRRGIRLGTALIATSDLSGKAKYMATAGREFDAVTPGNEMKWGTVEPNRGQFNWTGADQIVAFAQANNRVVRGHNLVWHQQLRGWLTSGDATTTQSEHF